MVLTTLLSSSVEKLFRIPPGMHTDARLLLLIVAPRSASASAGVFGGMLEGCSALHSELDQHRRHLAAPFDRLFSAPRIRPAHRRPDHVIMPIFSSILRGIVVFRLCRALGPKYVDRDSFRHMAITAAPLPGDHLHEPALPQRRTCARS